MQQFEERVDRAVARWVGTVDRQPGRVLIVCALLTVLAGIYAARNLGVDADPEAMIARDLPFRKLERELERSFRTEGDAMLVVIDAESAVTAARAADSLAERLRAQPELFARVEVPGGGEFFRRNALLYLDVPELEQLSDRLAQVQPFLAEVARDQSLVGVADLLRRAAQARSEGQDVGLDLAQAFDRVSSVVEASAEGRRAPDPWSDALIGGSLSEAARHRVVSVAPKLDYDELLSAAPAIEAVRKAARELALGEENGVRVRITGDPVLNYEELLVVNDQTKLVAAISVVMFTVTSMLAMRSVRVVLAMVINIVVCLIWTNAFAAVSIGHLNQISAACNVLIVGLGGEFGIHVCMRYAELARKGRSRLDALKEMGGTLGSSLVSSAGTTAIGFYVFLPTDYTGVAELGLIAGTGIFVSLVASLSVLPALLSLGTPAYPSLPPAKAPPISHFLEHFPVRHARAIRWTAALLALGSLLLLTRTRFDHNPVNLRDPTTESVQAFEDLLSRSESSPWTIDVIAPDLAAAQELAKRLDTLPVVERAITIADYVPAQQEEKLAILETAALFLPPPRNAAPPPDAAAQRAALERLRERLVALDSAPADDALAPSARRLADALERLLTQSAGDGGAALGKLQQSLVGSLPQQLADLETALAPAPVALDDLPPHLRDRMLAADGRARVEVYPHEDLSDSAAVARFVDGVRSLAPQATGSAVSLVEWGRVTVQALRQALISAVVIGTLFLLLLWRRAWDTLLAFFPLGLMALFTCAAMVLLDMPFNFANVIVLPMLLGMGIDSGIHLVHRHRTDPDEVDVLHTSTARAVFFSALTTISSFAGLAFAPHRGMAAIGELLTLGVGLTLVCYVVVLPAVLEWDDRMQRRRGGGRRGGAAGS